MPQLALQMSQEVPPIDEMPTLVKAPRSSAASEHGCSTADEEMSCAEHSQLPQHTATSARDNQGSKSPKDLSCFSGS